MSAGSTVPRVSVGVFAHDRRRYLPSAVTSVLQQEFPRSHVQVVVVTNYADAEIDPWLDERGVQRIRTPEVPLGAKVSRFLSAASAPVVTFLEDDDRYAPSRLAEIVDAFGSTPDLGYLHNAQQFIDERETPLPDGWRSAAQRAGERYGVLDVPPGTATDLLLPLSRVTPDFNLSSIAVSRALLATLDPILGQLGAAVDSLLFYGALSLRYRARLTPRRLTRYRIHSESDSRFAGTDPDEALERHAQYLDRFVRNFAPVYRLVVERGDPGAVRLASNVRFGTEVVAQVVSRKASRRRVARSLLSYLRTCGTVGPRTRPDVLTYGTLALLSPGRARSLFVSRRWPSGARSDAKRDVRSPD